MASYQAQITHRRGVPGLQRHSRMHGAHAVVTMPAEIDVTNAGTCQAVLESVLVPGVVALIADMTATVFCDCHAAHMLAQVHSRAGASNAQFRVAAPCAAVRRILALTGIARLLPIYPDVSAAMRFAEPEVCTSKQDDRPHLGMGQQSRGSRPGSSPAAAAGEDADRPAGDHLPSRSGRR